MEARARIERTLGTSEVPVLPLNEQATFLTKNFLNSTPKPLTTSAAFEVAIFHLKFYFTGTPDLGRARGAFSHCPDTFEAT